MILITGAAGFIGFFTAKKLLENGYNVLGIDNLNDYYDRGLKENRLEQLKNYPAFQFVKMNLEDYDKLGQVFKSHEINTVINLAAQAGVRYSLENPHSYIQSNIVGFLNILELCQIHQVKHLIFASSSSVYGANTKIPFSTDHNVDHPMSLYAASKKSNELMAHSYASLYGLACTGLRFFTVYGPQGRPDMAYFLFTKAIIEDKPIKVFNHGKMRRDFTYIDDVVEAIIRLINTIPRGHPGWSGDNPDPARSYAPYRIYNIGNNQPVELLEFIEIIEKNLGKKAQKEYLPMQAGDVPETFADVTDLMNDVGFKPNTSLETGLARFILWYKDYYQV